MLDQEDSIYTSHIPVYDLFWKNNEPKLKINNINIIRKLHDGVIGISPSTDVMIVVSIKRLDRNLEIYQYCLILRHDMHCNSRENKR